MTNKVCCIFNTPSHYRERIYRRIEEAFDCDWYFEDTDNNVNEFDTGCLENVKRLHSTAHGRFYSVKGLASLIKNPNYTHYIVAGLSRNFSTMMFMLLKGLFYRDKKVFLWTHGFYGKESSFEAMWKKLLYKYADGLLIYGDYACDIMKRRGFDECKLHPIHNSLDYDAQLKIRKRISPEPIYGEHFGNNNPTLVFIGRLSKVKRLDMLIQSVADLKISGREINLTLVGGGSESDLLKTLSTQLGIEKQVWFYGPCYDELTNARLIYNADLCVAPGNIGLTAMHVMMFGCPAISHNDFANQMPEFEAIKDGKTGTFFRRDSQKSLNNAIERWFSQESYNRESIRQFCFDEIDRNWTPNYQINILKSLIPEA